MNAKGIVKGICGLDNSFYCYIINMNDCVSMLFHYIYEILSKHALYTSFYINVEVS